jgi:SAM-dependent methyltransferase
MGETAKAKPRREMEGWFEAFAPSDKSGIDIGCQHDPLNETFRRWDLIYGDGDATLMNGVSDSQFVTVYASHVLEHLQDPVTAIRNWHRICKPNGHIIVIVPHRDLYERKLMLPSQWNHDHKWFYLPDRDDPPHTISLRRMIVEAIQDPDILHIRTLQDGWFPAPVEQHASGEYSIEAIIRKR